MFAHEAPIADIKLGHPELGPFIPQQRTSGDCIGMSVSCHWRTFASGRLLTPKRTFRVLGQELSSMADPGY
jgi:hypothetical protein